MPRRGVLSLLLIASGALAIGSWVVTTWSARAPDVGAPAPTGDIERLVDHPGRLRFTGTGAYEPAGLLAYRWSEEDLDHEWQRYVVRDALFTPTPGTITYRTTLGEGADLLFGVHSEDPRAVVTYTVTVEDPDGRSAVQFRETVASDGVWQDFRVGLFNNQAGTYVVTLTADSDREGNTVFWSNPMIRSTLSNLDQGFDYTFSIDAFGIAGRDVKQDKIHSDDLNVRILPWIEAHADDRFYLYIHSVDTHRPFAPPELPPHLRSDVADDAALYDAEIYGSPKVRVGHCANRTRGGRSRMLVQQSMIIPMSADAEWKP